MFGPLFDFLADYFYFRFHVMVFRLTGNKLVATIFAGFMAIVLGIVLLLALFFVLKMLLPPKPVA
jgi:hypothetical protein